MTTTKLVIVRHGESQWNSENRFTGWCDIDLSKKGIEEAKFAGFLLKKKSFIFDIAYTSMLKRAIHTLWYILDELDQAWIPVKKSWKLNERHYGALQGLNKLKIAEKYGDKQVQQWRRSFSQLPPLITKDDKNFPGKDIRYEKLTEREIPLSESLSMTVDRVTSYWRDVILPNIKEKRRVIIVAHGNSLRGLVKYLDKMNEEEIVKLEIPTGIPIVYELNEKFNPIKRCFLSQ